MVAIYRGQLKCYGTDVDGADTQMRFGVEGLETPRVLSKWRIDSPRLWDSIPPYCGWLELSLVPSRLSRGVQATWFLRDAKRAQVFLGLCHRVLRCKQIPTRSYK